MSQPRHPATDQALPAAPPSQTHEAKPPSHVAVRSPLPGWAQYLLAVLATLLVCLPLADLALGLDPTPLPMENRKLAPLPDLHFDATWTKFPALFETWEKDHFGLRSTLIHWHAVLMLDVLGVSPTSDVLIGRNGWLYLGANKAVDAYRCVYPFTKPELDAKVAELRERRDWLTARGIRYLNVWAPLKSNIYPEFLPAWVTKSGGPCRIDQWMARMRKEGFPVLDLRPALRKAKAEGIAYYPTDTHWNPRGGYFGYLAVMARLRAWFPQLEPIDAKRVKYYEVERLGGDLARLMDMQVRYKALELGAGIADKRCSLAGLNGLSRPKGIKLEAYECPPRPGDKPGPRVVMTHDSFGNALIPFLAQTFGRTLAAEFAGFDKELIEHEKPDLVIEVHLERQMQPDR